MCIRDSDAINLPAGDALRDSVVISNPLGEDTSIMRTTALPSVMDNIARNYNARAAECAVFEDATVYLPPVSYTHLDVYKRQGGDEA